MRIKELIGPLKALFEGKAKICSLCGKSMAGNHYWYKPKGGEGGWRCKGTGAVVPKEPGTPTPTTAIPAATPAPTSSVTPSVASPVGATPTVNTPVQAPVQAPVQNVKKSITEWLERFKVKNYTIEEDMTVNVNGDVTLDNMKWPKLPVKFGKVDGDFTCSGSMKFVSVENTPQEVTGDFVVAVNNIASAVGGPTKVGGDIVYSDNPITSFEGFPKTVGGSVVCENCSSLKSLHDIHKHIRSIGSTVSAEEGEEHLGGELVLTDTPIESNVLGVLLIAGLQKVKMSNNKVEEILNKHLEHGRSVYAAQEEMMDADLVEFADM